MSKSSISISSVYAGLDVHEDSIDIALAAAGCDGEVQRVGPEVAQHIGQRGDHGP
jgi:transposase